TSVAEALKFYPWENLGTMMTAPLLLIAGDKADTLPFSQAAYDADNGPKELYLVKGATHVDMYDKEPFVSEAVVKLADFFNQYLRYFV
ncbi:MAG: alpha/beta hydrolase, partial [Muribaculaceae bacterium]|nr:alpha/beta hydrolase [Muribaculaceae bacterium]